LAADRENGYIACKASLRSEAMKRIAQILFLLAFIPGAGLAFDGQDVYFPLRVSPAMDAPYQGWAVSLDLEYLFIESKLGMVNLAEPGHPMPEPGKIYLISEQPRVMKILELTGLEIQERLNLLSGSGAETRARIDRFAYYRVSTDSILTLALLKPEQKRSPGAEHWILAWKPRPQEPKRSSIKLLDVVKSAGDQCELALHRCENSWKRQLIREIACFQIKPPEPMLIVSFWRRPSDDSDIEDLQTEACAQGKSFAKKNVHLPAGIFPQYAFSMPETGLYYIIGYAGSGAQVCNYLIENKADKFRIVKQGLCVGY